MAVRVPGRMHPGSAIVTCLAAMAAGCGSNLSRDPQVILFDGRSTAGWQTCRSGGQGGWQVAGAVTMDPASPKQLCIKPGNGILVNSAIGGVSDFCTLQEFGDVVAHIEFLVPRDSNSGVYFMGRYELQILDSYGHQPLHYEDCGGIYARWAKGELFEGRPPVTNACSQPGTWQTFDVAFRAPRFDAAGKKIEDARFASVRQNGVLIHENVVLSGPTAGPLDNVEAPKGPLRLQGDHGPVAFRNLRVKLVSLP